MPKLCAALLQEVGSRHREGVVSSEGGAMRGNASAQRCGRHKVRYPGSPPRVLPLAVPTRHCARSSGEREGLVTSESLTIRFPSGAWEYVVTNRVPDIGDTLVREGETWTVALVAEPVDDHRVIIMALRPAAT